MEEVGGGGKLYCSLLKSAKSSQKPLRKKCLGYQNFFFFLPLEGILRTGFWRQDGNIDKFDITTYYGGISLKKTDTLGSDTKRRY